MAKRGKLVSGCWRPEAGAGLSQIVPDVSLIAHAFVIFVYQENAVKDRVPYCLNILLVLLLVALLPAGSGSAGQSSAFRKKTEKRDWREVVRNAKPQTPSIAEADVRAWFKTVHFPGFAMIALDSEFHPDEGNLLAKYRDKKRRMLFLSYIDHKRMSPYGFRRSAKEMISIGCKKPLREFPVKGRTWYGDDTSGPIIATDVTPSVKLVLLGQQGMTLDELPKLVEGFSLDSLIAAARQ